MAEQVSKLKICISIFALHSPLSIGLCKSKTFTMRFSTLLALPALAAAAPVLDVVTTDSLPDPTQVLITGVSHQLSFAKFLFQ